MASLTSALVDAEAFNPGEKVLTTNARSPREENLCGGRTATIPRHA
jgi:hypothetical protein